MSESHCTSPLIVALDYPSKEPALAMADMLDPSQCRLKVGKELFTRSGPDVVADLIGRGFDIFLDLKFHDIPNTVAKAVLAAAEAGVWMVNIHASGGRQMMQAARQELDTFSGSAPLLIGVTVLTSMNQQELSSLAVQESLDQHVERLALLAEESGLDGVVCSAHEVARIKEVCGKGFATVTPGIRPSGAAVGDQKRVMTPSQALGAGSDYLVIGRPITAAPEPMAVVQDILKEIESC